MASEAELSKHRRYDLSMSKRTRKPHEFEKVSLNHDDNTINGSSVSYLNQDDELLKGSNGIHQLSLSSLRQDDEMQKDTNEIRHSLPKELMNEGNGQERVANTETEVGDEVGGEMEAVTSEEKSSLVLVPKQGEGIIGVKTGGMVSRYVKVLSHLIKVKRGSKKKSVVPLLKP